MEANTLLDAGQLSAAITQLNEGLRAYPTDVRQRTFLFELLCFAGDYQRAGRQLDVIAHQSAAADVGVQFYRHLLEAEQARQRLFSAGLSPHFLLEPPPYVQLYLAALNWLRENRREAAHTLLAQAARSRPHLSGQCEGQAFHDFRDADDLLAPCLEVLVYNRYVWLPFEQISALQISPPRQLRDLLWIPATLTTRAGSVGEVILPVLYAGSSGHPNDQIKLGRMTDWEDTGEGVVRGLGQRLFMVDGAERAILELREMTFEMGTETVDQ